MTRVVVFCGLCGHEQGIELDVSPLTSEDEVRATIAARIAEPAIRCERCRSELIADSGRLAPGDPPPRLTLARKAEQMRQDKRFRGVRFAVGSADGPRGSVWRIWVHRNDVYVAPRAAASDMKVSLHASGVWRSGFTEQHAAREDALISPERDRAIDKWERPPEFAPGWTRAFVIVVAASEVVASDVEVANPDEIIWVDPLPVGWATHLTVLLSKPGATGSGGRGFATAEGREDFTEVVTRLELDNGESVWVVAHAEEESEESRRNIEALRARVLSDGKAAIDEVYAKGEPHDLRAFASGYFDDGTRYYSDVAVRPRNLDASAHRGRQT